MLRTDFGQLEMTDRRVDSLAQVLVQLNCAVLGAGMRLKIDDIGCIFRKGFAVIKAEALPDAVFKLDSDSLCLPLGALLRPCRGWTIGFIMTPFAVKFIITAMNRNLEAQTGFTVDFCDGCHVVIDASFGKSGWHAKLDVPAVLGFKLQCEVGCAADACQTPRAACRYPHAKV